MKAINITNKKVKFEYELIKGYEAGLSLKGSEVKSIKDGKVSLTDSFCIFDGNELFVKGLNITANPLGAGESHEPHRLRKLLLQRKELNKLQNDLVKGMTIVPYRLYVNDKGLIKMTVYLAKGKKEYDKRDTIKSRDLDRDMKREVSA
jgi:SsrA-binding protein